MARKKYKLLTYKDRKKLEEMYLNNERPSDIADKLGVHTATIYKELQQGDTGALDKNLRSEYSAELAQRKTTESLKNRGRNLEEAAALFVKKAQIRLFFAKIGSFLLQKSVLSYCYREIREKNAMKILNFGSCNIDIVYSLDHIVTVGETETGYRMAVFPGGKGLNQSIALARAGAKVYHAGCIGQDGEFLVELLDADGVDVSNIKRVDEKNGHAIIQVSAKGENAIFIYPGSNACMTPELIEQTLARFDRGDLLLLQNEINAPDRIVRLAYEKGLSVVLNPSPCNEIVRSLDFDKIAYLILNEVEAEMLTGCREPMQSLRYFGERYPTLKVVLTLGEKGSIYYENGNEIYQPAFEAKAVDTTAAGDTFTGYFLAGIATHGDISRALRMASAAAAIAVSRPGAAPSVPMAEEVMTAVDHMHEILPEGDKIQQIKRKTEAYIAAHLSDADTNGLSKELGYSNAYTRNLISQIYGQSFSKLLQGNRCRAAAELLADTDLSVHEIIERVGYENESFFRMLFKEKYGKNLLAYRHFMRGAKRTDGKNQLSKLAENE